MRLCKEHNELILPAEFEINKLETYLQEIWNDRKYLYDFDEDEPAASSSTQKFIYFLRGNRVKTSDYVGFIQLDDFELVVYPKLLIDLAAKDIHVFYRHLVYWLGYCRRINFPFNDILADLVRMDELPEALIHYFSRRALDILRTQPFSRFEVIEEEMENIKGKLVTHKYISQNVINGNYHKFICEHEPFVFDNLLNRIIKGVARKLIYRCKFKESWFNLEQILFLLDEVEDVPVTIADCNKVIINQVYEGYEECLEMCRFFLAGEQLRSMTQSDRQFCFLLPMNHIFEDFLCGFIEIHFKGRISSSYQYREWLTDQGVFQMRSDLVLLDNDSNVSVIIDSKYKIREGPGDNKKGISQSDMYQMVSYAVRNNCNKVLLLYPKQGHPSEKPAFDTFTISSPMLNDTITVTATSIAISSDDPSTLDKLVLNQLEGIFRHEIINILK